MGKPEISREDWRALHGALLVLCFALTAAALPVAGNWPYYLLVPVLLYGVLTLLLRPLRRTCGWFSLGHWDRATILLTFTIILASSGILVAYHALAHPDLDYLRAKLPIRNLLLAFGLFPLCNAVLEEVVFRGILLDAIQAYWGWTAALILTSLAFGFGHLGGYPPGWIGAVLAGVYGLALGLLRQQADGLMPPIVAHVFADATIMTIVTLA